MVVRQKEGRSIGRILFEGRDQSFAHLYLKNPKLDVTRPAYKMLLIIIGIQGVKGRAYRVQGGQGVGLQGPRGSRGRPTGSQGVKG